MKVAVINPQLVAQRDDPLTTGIVYMPIGLAYVAAYLRSRGMTVYAIDAFAERPWHGRPAGRFLIVGLTEAEVLARLAPDTQAVIVYAINLTNHVATLGLVRAIRAHAPALPILVLENTQAVSAYALRYVADEFYQAGATHIVTGEGELRVAALLETLRVPAEARPGALDGVGTPTDYTPPASVIPDLDQLPFPAWDLFPLENYWRLRFAHGPQTLPRYLPLLTSRGCPYPCHFCVVPATNQQQWRPRTAENVVAEMAWWHSRYGVSEFHIEDLDPTISDQRIRALCQLILDQGLPVTWKLAAGTKAETIRSEATLELMARAGCRYISISPETGSPRLLKQMRKPFDYEHARRLVRKMAALGIYSQLCFVLGYPTETDEDRRLTQAWVHEFTRLGADEIALFIITPVPGSAIYADYQGYSQLSELNFSPAWRPDYQQLSRFRRDLYVRFLFWKLRYAPLKLLRQPGRFLTRAFQTKMEMVPYRAAVLKWIDITAG